MLQAPSLVFLSLLGFTSLQYIKLSSFFNFSFFAGVTGWPVVLRTNNRLKRDQSVQALETV
jgi:hypothetical protein